MLRVPLLCLAIFAAAWLEFTVFPGHTYLEGDTQLYVPMLERMAAPGLLSRDLVATNGSLSLTAYDEATLLIHEGARQPLRRALLAQEFVCRLAALLGLFLLARATGLSHLFAFLIAAVISLGASLAGPAVLLTNPEPLPGAFAFSLALLAMGLLTQELALLAAIAGGLAFLYDPALAAPFWFVLAIAFAFDAKIRKRVRPMLPVFLIFILLLANLAQLQPGTAAQPLLARLSPNLVLFQHAHAPQLYVHLWPKGEVFQILALFVFGVWAAARCWPLLSSFFRWLLLGTSICGILSIPVSYLLIDQAHFSWAARVQPTRTLLFAAAGSALLFGLAGMRAMLRRSPAESAAWFFLLFSLPMSHGVFDFLRVTDASHLTEFGLALALAALLTALLLRFAGSDSMRFVTLAVPLVAAFALANTPQLRPKPIPMRASITEMAAWADSSTWGSSIFLFPDAGRKAYPSVFRAQSRHGLWVDWNTSRGVTFSDAAAARWQERWRDSMQGGFSTEHLEKLLPLPIDYYVLRTQDQLAGTRHAFQNRDFVVYDAEDLRNAPKPLRLAAAP